jgi:hypothetical protein
MVHKASKALSYSLWAAGLIGPGDTRSFLFFLQPLIRRTCYQARCIAIEFLL